jgi:hypothetical protein
MKWLAALAAVAVCLLLQGAYPPASATTTPPRVATLSPALQTYLESRPTVASVRVRDLVTGHEYSYRSRARYDSASIVKVAIMVAILRRRESHDRHLTSWEKQQLSAMIQRSDNLAASKLWASFGRGPAMARFYTRAGMTRSTPGPGRYWGLSQINAGDEVILLSHLARPTTLVNDAARRYAQRLMASVVTSQRWGVSAGPTADGGTVELKNGWLSRTTQGWRIHSIGHVQGNGRDYLIAVLSTDNPTKARGVATVEGVSRIVWRELAPAVPQE